MGKLFNRIFIESIYDSSRLGYLIINEVGLKQIIAEMRRKFPYFDYYENTGDDEDYFYAVKDWFVEWLTGETNNCLSCPMDGLRCALAGGKCTNLDCACLDEELCHNCQIERKSKNE